MWKRLRAWLLPVSCLGCATPDVALCVGCGPKAGERVVDAVAGVTLTAAGSYTSVLRQAIVAMKRGERDYLDPFAALLAELTLPGIPLVPLPTSRRRAAARGFDQAVELAMRAARVTGAPCANVLEKRGIAQRGLDRRARLASGDRFRVRRGVAVPEVAIVVARTPPGRNSLR
jgi:predicted amidophosphoribosyltransferase